MAASAQCARVTRAADGRVLIEWADGSGVEFASVSDAVAYGAAADEGGEGVQLAKRLLIARWARLDASLTDTSGILNKTCTINAGAAQPVQIG
jgi:hypothetical protein